MFKTQTGSQKRGVTCCLHLTLSERVIANGLGLLQLSFHWEASVSIGNKNNWHTHRQKSLNSCNFPSPFRTLILLLPSHKKEMCNDELSSWWKLLVHQYICQSATCVCVCVFKNIIPEKFNSVIYTTILWPMTLW